jgi:hypothetical protein
MTDMRSPRNITAVFVIVLLLGLMCFAQLKAAAGRAGSEGGTGPRLTAGLADYVWSQQVSGTSAQLEAAHFLDENQGWVAGAGCDDCEG